MFTIMFALFMMSFFLMMLFPTSYVAIPKENILVEQCVYDDKDIRITAFKIETYKDDSRYLSLKLENNTDSDLYFTRDVYAINCYLGYTEFYTTIKANTTTQKTLKISSLDIRKFDIDTVDTIKLSFNIYESDSYGSNNIYVSTPISTIYTDTYNEGKVKEEIYPALCFSSDDMKVYLDDSFKGNDDMCDLNYLVYNTSNTYMNVSFEDFMINDLAIEHFMIYHALTYPGTKDIGSFKIEKSYLKELQVTTISKISFYVAVQDFENNTTVKVSDKITVMLD